MPVSEAEVDSAKIYFKLAESAYYDDDNYSKAFKLYALVDSLYPASPFAPKALYARAWIAEKEMARDSLAIKLLTKLTKKFPQDTLAVIAQRRITITQVKEDTTSQALLDTSLTSLEDEYFVYYPEEVDSVPVCQEDSLEISAIILQENLYPMRALSARKKGLAVLELTINKYGYPEDIEIFKDIPPGYGFGEAAIEVLEYLHFTPGRLDNAPVNVRIEQRIKFEL